MKKILFSLFTVCSVLTYAQTWQSIGVSQGSSVNHQDITIDPVTGDLYMAYSETGVTKTTVKRWQNNAWVAVGNVNFGPGSNHVDVRIQALNGQPYVAIKHLSGSLYYIQVYRLSGTWTAMGSTQYETNANDDWNFKVSPSGDVYLHYYNMTAGVGTDNELITLYINNVSQNQVGGIINSDATEDWDLEIDENDVVYSIHEEGNMSNYVNLKSANSPEYDQVDLILDEWVEGIVTDLPDNYEDLRLGAVVDPAGAAPNYLVSLRYNITSLSGGTVYTIYNAPPDAYDMASNTANDYFFYTSGTNMYAESINGLGTQTNLGTNFGTGTGVPLDPKVETWNDRVVVAYVRNSAVHVMELDNQASITLGTAFSACEETLTSSPGPAFTVDDNNYSHADLFVYVYSTQAEVLSSNITVTGSYPTYYVQFISEPITVTTSVEFEIEMEEPSGYTYEYFYPEVIAFPTINLTLPNDEICENHGIVNLLPYGSPAGGFWTGPGVNTATGKFNPDLANPGLHVLNYSYSNQGCANDDNATMTVHAVPSITVATTPANCGDFDGAANATISGGTVPYTIYWSNGETTEDIADLAAGMYYINVVDNEGCESVKPATITSNGLTLSATTTGVICAGGTNGAIDLTVVSGSGIESIEWSNGATTEDLTNLAAGFYEVTVTANDGCVSTASYEVTSPDAITVVANNISANCATSDGSATSIVSGGTAPYSYQWFVTSTGTPVGTNSPTLSAVPAAAYFVIITDDNGCTKVHNTAISEVGGPDVDVVVVTPAGCAGDGAIDIAINSDEPVVDILWTSGQTTEDISSLTPGNYSVEVTDALGCMGMVMVDLPAASPDINPLCLITVDTSTNTNLLVWEKPVTTDISHFNIYRETSMAGVFQFVDSVLYADESIFNDTVASPQVRSWRYKLTAVNLCGEESDQSDFHKTIHLTINLGLGGQINLAWDDYEGFPVLTYDLYRHTTSSGWVLIQQMPSNLFSYQDTPPTSAGLDYIISVDPPATCTSTNKAQDHNSSRSNRTASAFANLPGSGINENSGDDFMSVYPNPSNGEFVLNVNPATASSYEVLITDATGRLVMKFSANESSSVIDLSTFSDGVYNLQLLVNDNVINKKLVKQ